MSTMSFPANIRVKLLKHAKSDLLVAMSDDLRGLMTVGHSLEEMERRIPASIAELIKAEHGVDVEVSLTEEGESPDMISLTNAHVELRAA